MVWLLFGVGLGLLVLGADLLVKGAERLASSLGISALVVGLTVVAFGTSAPELAVSVKAAYSGQAELAIANVVGSNIFNILFILGLAALVSPLIISQQLIRQDVPIMIAVSLLLLFFVWDGRINRAEAGIFVAGLVAYTCFLFYQSKTQGSAENPETQEPSTANIWWQNVLLVVVGLTLLVVGARWLVQSAIDIATILGVNEAVIGLTIVAAGTSLPEVVTSVVATIRGQRDIAVGNVVGSNIFNILCVLGFSGLLSPTPLLAGEQLASVDIPAMTAVALLCLPLFFAGSILNRFEGFFMLVLYAAYTWLLVALALSLAYAEQLKIGILYGLIPAIIVYAATMVFLSIRKR